MLRRAFARVDDDDVRLFYCYFDELKDSVRGHLRRKARSVPGESAVAQSALFSMLCDVTLARIPLSDVDADGHPALWQLLLKYIERHCEKWNKYYRAKRFKGTEVPLAGGDSGGPGIDPPDYRASAGDEEAVGEALAALHAKLTQRQRRVADLTAEGRTLKQIAGELNCSESLVSMEKKAIRKLLETT
jgi:DNA-binding CsgD family transcriptional regulator